MAARINTRFPVREIMGSTRLVCCLGYPTAEVGEGVTVEDRNLREKYPRLLITHVITGKARDVPEEYLPALGAEDHAQLYEILENYYRTGISGRVPVTLYEVVPADEADVSPWFHEEAETQ